jgi:PAS domain S-box-containing protein
MARLEPDEYAVLVEQAPILIWRSNTAAACDYFNDRWLEYTGRNMEQEYGNGWAEGVHPDDFDGCLAIYLRAFEKREIFEMEYRLRRHDGAYRWVLDRGVPFYRSGEFAGFIGSCVDINERVEARSELAAAHEAEMGQLRGLLPICSHCKRIRDDQGDWHQVEQYVRDHSEAEFSHGVCPDCLEAEYPDYAGS